MRKIIISILFALVFSLILLVRVVGLDISPMSAGFDEVSLGYNAYSILLTGKDEYGTPFPLSLRSYNDFKPALYSYLAIPFIKIWGLNDTTTRLPSAFMGTIALIFIYLIIRQIGPKRHILFDLLVTLFISFLPWRLHFSRVAFESNISMAFFSGMIWCLINFQKNKLYKIGVILFSVFAIYSYHAARLSVPLMLLLFFIDPIKFKFKNFIKNPTPFLLNLWPLIIVLLCYIPLFWESRAANILTRYSQTNVFTHFYPFTPIELKITENIWFNPIAHPLYFLIAEISGHIFSYFSPRNLSLLIYPGVIKSAQAIGGSGMVGFLGGAFFICGFIFYLKKLVVSDKLRFVIYWILCGIAPAALTWEWFYPLRSINIYPAIDLIITFGIFLVFSYLIGMRQKIVGILSLGVLTLIMVMFSTYNLINEYGYGSWQTSGEFQPGGFKEAAPILSELKDKYKTVYLDSNQAQSYALFWYYMKYPPEKVQALSSRRNAPGVEGPPTIDFDNFVYKKFDWPKDRNMTNFAYWTSAEVKESEIYSEAGTNLIKIKSPNGYWIASIITKD